MNLKARTILLVSSLSYVLATGIGIDTVLGDGLRLLGILTLLFGIFTLVREIRSEKK